MLLVDKRLRMMVIRTTEYNIRSYVFSLDRNTCSFFIFHKDFLHGTVSVNVDSQTSCQGLHRFDDFVHTPFRMPGAESEIGEVHKTVERRSFTGFGTQK